jgi:peptide/nickel transport system permease protein
VRYFLQRLLQTVVVFLAVTFLVMAFTRFGQDPERVARDMAGGISARPDEIAKITEQYKLDSNIIVQYFAWVKNIVTLDLGFSKLLGVPVTQAIADRAPMTLFIGIYALIFGLIISLPLAIWSAYRRDGWFDKTSSTLSFAVVSMPNIVLALLLGFLFAARLDWFPFDSEKIWPWDDPIGHFKNVFLPVVALGLPIAAIFTRLLRGDLVNTLQSDFITLARAKGLSPNRILWRHALRSSVFSLMTVAAIQAGAILGGAAAIELIFSVPGMGSLLVISAQTGDLLVLQACAAVFALAVVFVNFVVDLLYAVVDPRIRHARALG